MIDNSHFYALVLAIIACALFAILWQYGDRILPPIASKIRNFFYYHFSSRSPRGLPRSQQVSNSVTDTVGPLSFPQQRQPDGGYPTSAAYPQQPPWTQQAPGWGVQDTGWGAIEQGGGNYVPSTPLSPPPQIQSGPVRTPPPVRHTPNSLGGNGGQTLRIAQWMADPVRSDLKRTVLIQAAMTAHTISESTAARAYRESRKIIRGQR